jgi:hypothetical protein
VKPQLSKAAIQLREQIDDAFPDRDRSSDGWLGDTRHAARKSDHNPDWKSNGMVRAIDIDADLNSHKSEAFDLADQLRVLAKADKRLAYIIFAGKITSKKSLWRWVKYRGINPHHQHIHVSFSKKGDNDGSFFKVPIIGG